MAGTGRSVLRAASVRLPLRLRRHLLYLRAQHRLGRLRHPVLLTEKVNWRILVDRREVLSWTCDKLRMKDYARRTAGDLVRVPRTLWAGRDVAELAALAPAGPWVLKPNHLSGPVLFGAGRPDVQVLRERTRDWLGNRHADELGEWAYGHAERTLIAEERIGGGQPPPDYKFFVFDGRPVCVQVDTGRFTDHRRTLYDLQWRPLPVLNAYPGGEPVPRPRGLPLMLAAAARLGAPFDFMRVDLYDVEGEVWFGELTPYPGGGLEPFAPRHVDHWLGRQWRLPEL